MQDPKILYRELDSLLASIRLEKTDGNFISDISEMLESRFSETAQIRNGRVYELRGNEYSLVFPETPKETWKTRIPKNAQAITLLEKNRSYIFDDPNSAADFYNKSLDICPPSLAILIHNQDKIWILTFELAEAWSREQINLFMNSVRTSLNYRLFTDSMGGRLEQAVQIQKSLLPKESPAFENFEIVGRSQPAELVGGDFYDYHELRDSSLGISIGDASGHGIPAALLVRDVVIGLRMGMAKELRLVHTLEKLNTVIQRSTYSTNFVSLFFGELEQDGHFFYANAGHPAPFLISDRGYEDMPATGITLGFLPDIKLSRSHIHLPENSVLVMYTDGIIERENDKGEQLDIIKLKKLVHKNRKKSAAEILDAIFDLAFEFGNNIAWEDDATAVVVKRLASN